MRNALVFLLLFVGIAGYGQRINPHQYDLSDNKDIILETGSNLSNDTTIDVNFYNIDIEIALDSAFVSGRVVIGFESLIDGLTVFKLDLDSAFSIDSISFPASSFAFADNILTISLSETYNVGEYVSLAIYYQGVPILAGGYKGLRYEVHDGNELIIASLSTPYLAHTWWPCKDGTQDKSDSTFVYITIKDTIVSSIPVTAISNGILDTVEVIGNKKKFKWKHYYPIVPYYVMVAISNYEHFQQNYSGITSFPLDYYVFESHLSTAQIGVEELPDAMEFFESVFGPYPFANEKYGMTQLGYYGAIENQTNTITNNMSYSWFFVSVHELAHMWFADMITCNTWHHGWLNEGFASYAEALYSEHQYNNYHTYIENFVYTGGGTVYMENVSDPFNVFQSIIYNKGAYVLHMLRGVVGDSIFFDIVYEYSTDQEFMYKLATTEEFHNICENVSGMDLDYFFEQWIYDERFPMYYYNFEYNSELGKLDIVINQEQQYMGWREVFEMPIDVGIVFTDGSDTIIEVANDERFSEYSILTDKDVDTVMIDPNNWILKNLDYDPDISVGIYVVVEQQFVVYPNPSFGSFNIRFSKQIINSPNNVKLYNMHGKLSKKYINIQNDREIEISGLEEGMYLLCIENGGDHLYRKVIVMGDN